MDAAMPATALRRCIGDSTITAGGSTVDLSGYSSVYVVAFGKAADPMARAAAGLVDVAAGIIIVPKDSRPLVRSRRFQVLESSHPVPDRSSVHAAKAVLKFVRARKASEFVLFLVSGGSSSLLCLPDSVELSDKAYTTDLLLRSGADIREINCIRKHLSKIKGGRLAEQTRCDAAALVMSDVRGDDPSDIASGTTYCDGTTFSEAQEILQKYGLTSRVPQPVLEHIGRGAASRIPETPKQPRFANHIIARNSDCIEAMAHKAKKMNYQVHRLEVYGDIKAATSKIVRAVRDNPDSCIIFGGETTVNVIGRGAGGRNQELALRLLKNLQDSSRRTVIATLATDGIDGNTKNAGVLTKRIDVDPDEAKSFLKNSDSASFFEAHGGLIKTGYTGTNLMDIGLVLP